MYAIRSSRSTLAGYSTHVWQAGAGHNALVWFPALLDSAHSFGRAALSLHRKLPPTVRLVAVDPPGYGESTLEPGRAMPSFRSWERWTRELVEHLGSMMHGRFVFAGNSSGGVAATLAARHAASAAGLLLVCWSDFFDHPAPNVPALCPRDRGEARRLLGRSWHRPPSVPPLSMDAMLQQTRREDFVSHVASFDPAVFRLQLREVRAPLMVIGGDSDELVPPHAVTTTARRHGGTSEVLRRTGHYPHRESVPEFTDLVARVVPRWLEETELPRRMRGRTWR